MVKDKNTLRAGGMAHVVEALSSNPSITNKKGCFDTSDNHKGLQKTGTPRIFRRFGTAVYQKRKK
jgi:hypothetical protein